MKQIIISACLAGERTRYDGKQIPVFSALISKWREQGRLKIVCPEVSGGLSTPRPPAQIVGGDGHDVLRGAARVIDENGKNVTGAFVKGGMMVLGLAQKYEIELAVLKEKSPSCGVNRIYDGNFSSVLISGVGVTTALLRENGVRVVTEEGLDRVVDYFG